MVHVDCCHCCYGGWRERDGNDYWIQLTHRDTVGVHSYSDKHKAHQHTQPREPTSTKTQKLCKTTTIDLENTVLYRWMGMVYMYIIPMREAEEGGWWVKESQRGDKRESTPRRRPLTSVPQKMSS